MNSKVTRTKAKLMDAKLKNKILKACLAIKSRERKLDGSDGLCAAIYNLFDDPVGDREYYAVADLIQYLSNEMFGKSKYDPYISVRYRWTARRAKLLDKLTETLSSRGWKKTIQQAEHWREIQFGPRWIYNSPE